MKMANLVLFALAVASGSCSSGVESDLHDSKRQGISKPETTTVEVIDSVYNFGKLKGGEIVTFSYRFRNTGENPLIITDVIASCGCTTPEKPQQPIQPRSTGVVRIAFNSDGVSGAVRKNLSVISNAEPDFPLLLLEGEVLHD